VPGVKDRLTDAGYGLGWSVACRLPESWAQRGFRFAADLAWRRQGPGVQVLEGNLRRVIGSQAPGGELRALSRQAMRSYARYWLEAFRLPVMPAGRLIARRTPSRQQGRRRTGSGSQGVRLAWDQTSGKGEHCLTRHCGHQVACGQAAAGCPFRTVQTSVRQLVPAVLHHAEAQPRPAGGGRQT
jgi:lauroyl/myristoyl acyltransferase